MGAFTLASAFSVNPAFECWWLGLGGIVLIVFGVLLLIFAFRLRSRLNAAEAR